jgi:bilin biosynthesis protein
MENDQQPMCEKCGSPEFEYDSYYKEYSCKECGWIVKDPGKSGLLPYKQSEKETLAAQKPSILASPNKGIDSGKALRQNVENMDAKGDIIVLAKALKHAREYIVEKAAINLIKIGKPALVPLTEALKDENVRARQMAAVVIREIAGKESIGDKRTIEPLIQALNDQDEGVRGTATEALGRIGKPAVEFLIEALKNEDEHARLNAIMALSMIGDKRAVDPLSSASKDESEIVRKAATMALEKVKKGQVFRPTQ